MASAPANAGKIQDRQKDGRFKKGTSGNPAGKKKGAKNRQTIEAEKLLQEAEVAITDKVLNEAMRGNRWALTLAFSRIHPPARENKIKLEDLPEVANADDAMKALSRVVRAVANGEITVGEAHGLSRLLSVFIRCEEADLERMLEDLEYAQELKD